MSRVFRDEYWDDCEEISCCPYMPWIACDGNKCSECSIEADVIEEVTRREQKTSVSNR